jgi:PAS domain S-box-containing protein
MSETPETNAERVLVLAPTAAAAALTGTILREARLECHACASVSELERELARGVGVLLVTEDLLAMPDAAHVFGALERQPPWSDVPILLLSTAGFDSPSVSLAMESLGNVTVLERPVRLSTLVSALRTAIRARRRQYELRDRIHSLKESEDRFHIVARTVHESIYDLDVASGRFWSSETARPLLGRAPEPEASFAEWTARRHPEDAGRVGDSFERALVGDDSTWSEEYRFQRDDGSYVTIFDSAHILRDPAGRAVRVVGAMLDMSERQRAEATRALHAAIVESSDDAIVSKTLDGTILSWNGGAERLFGWAAEEAIGRPIQLIIPPGRESEEAELIQRLRQGRRVEHFETVRRRKDGSMVVISLTLSPIRDSAGKVVAASKVARDITLRRTSEDMLRKQSQRLRLLLEAASILLTSDDLDIMMRALFAQISDHLELHGYAHWVLEESRPPRLMSSAGLPEEALVALDPLVLDDPAACAVVLARLRLPDLDAHAAVRRGQEARHADVSPPACRCTTSAASSCAGPASTSTSRA